MDQREPETTKLAATRADEDLRWADLPLCVCSLRHWPEEIAARHVISLVSGPLETASVWVSGDAPEERNAARVFTEQVASLGVRRIVDVRAEASRGSSFDPDVLAAHSIDVLHFGVIDHNDAFADVVATRAWAESLRTLPAEPTLVHCHMGVNRSASAAVLLLMARGFPADVVTRAVLDGRPAALAIYAPAALRSVSQHADAELVRQIILAERREDRRLRDAQLR